MPTYTKAPSFVAIMATELLCRFESHKPLLDAKVKIDLLFARANLDDKGNPVGFAITEQGRQVLGKTRVVSLKDRAKGNADAEILLDGDWWESESAHRREALLDHELHHISVVTSRQGAIKTDDLNRPKLKLRKHDWQFGWFDVIAERHGEFSVERQQAAEIWDKSGQLYWEAISPAKP